LTRIARSANYLLESKGNTHRPHRPQVVTLSCKRRKRRWDRLFFPCGKKRQAKVLSSRERRDKERRDGRSSLRSRRGVASFLVTSFHVSSGI